jgi:hypothetical protein
VALGAEEEHAVVADRPGLPHVGAEDEGVGGEELLRQAREGGRRLRKRLAVERLENERAGERLRPQARLARRGRAIVAGEGGEERQQGRARGDRSQGAPPGDRVSRRRPLRPLV